MADLTVFHNPRCSKSRAAMATLEEVGAESEVVRYLDAPPDRATLESIIAKLEDPVASLVRAGDAKTKGIDLPDLDDAGAVIDLLLAHPELMERPVLVKGDRAIIGRPTERVAPFVAG